MPIEFWLGYVVAGTKFALIGYIFGQMRMARAIHRRVRSDHGSM